MGKELLSIVIPAYNEEKIIAETIKETFETLKHIKGLSFEFIIVDDGSIDNTYNVTREIASQPAYDIKIISYSPNKGKGFALKKGALATSGNYVLFMDADLEIHPNQIVSFLKFFKKSMADAVIGSKTTKGSVVNLPLKRKIISSGYYFLLKLLFRLPMTDTQTGFKLFKRFPLIKCIRKASINGYTFDLELMIIMSIHKYKIIEYPIKINELRLRRIRMLDSLSMFKDILVIFKKCYFSRSYF